MKKRFFTLILSLCLVTVTTISLTACSDKDNIPSYSYNESYFQFIEDGGDKIYSTQALATETERAEYSFENTLSDNVKNKCVYYTEQILSKLNSNKIKVNVFDENKYNSTYLDGNNLYTHVQDYKTVDYATTVLLANFGEYCNYGLAYGYANYIAKELGWEYSTQNELPTTSNEYLYDMNLLCFSEQYVEKYDISFCKKLSVYFVNNYIENIGVEEFEKLLVSSGDNEQLDSFNTTLSNWYLQNGIKYAPSTIIYRLGGELYEFIAKSNYASFWIRKSWTDTSITSSFPILNENFLHESYNEVKETFEDAITQLTFFRKLLDLDDYNDTLKIRFKNYTASFYDYGLHEIWLNEIESLTHEYIHSIATPYLASRANSIAEGLAQYFSYSYPDKYIISMRNYYYNELPQEQTLNNRYIFEFKATKGRDVDFSKDYHELEDLYTYYFSITSPDKSYQSAASFLHYIVTNYGERTAINYYLSHNGTFTELDKSFNELVADWQDFINTIYKNYTKYNYS